MQLYLYSGAAHLEQSYPLLIAMAVIVVLVMVSSVWLLLEQLIVK